MSNKICKRLMLLFVLGVLTFLAGCDSPYQSPPPIGCTVPELINAIIDANTNPDHDHIVLLENCDYGLGETYFEVPEPSEYFDYGYAGLPPITGTPEFRIFYIGSGGSLALVELDLENGYVSGPGGAVLIDGGTLTLNQCVLMDNHGKGGGGAIANRNGQLVLTNAILRHNSAPSGGAITNHNGSVDIDFESVLEHNEVTYNGGAISTSAGDLTIYNSTIRENSAEWDGGGILAETGTVTLHGVVIENNQARYSGGGVLSENASLSISNSLIRQNQARWGGGLSVEWRDVSISQGTQISDNLADEYGGGIYILGTSTLTFEDCSIADNQAGIGGGGIGHGHDRYDPTISISNCTVSGNSANVAGGGIFIRSGEWNINDSTISGNSADEGGGIGHGYSQDDPTISMSSCAVSGNSANDLGGGIFIRSGEWEINASTISGNSADEGGGIYNQGRLIMQNSTISTNQGQRGGGILHDSQSVADLSFVTIAENTASSGGGLLIDRTFVHITHSLITRNVPDDCQGSTQPFDENLDGDGSCGFNISADPLLEPLADNGGPTHTHAIPPFSPAAEAAAACTVMNSTVPISVDQRGEPRPQGAGCDLGAYEASLSALPLPPLDTPTPTHTYTPLNFIVNLDAFCRFGPGTHYHKVAYFPAGTFLTVNGQNEEGTWFWSEEAGCWLSDKVGELEDTLQPIQILTPPPPPTWTPTPESEPGKPPACYKAMKEDECEASGGTWVPGATTEGECDCP